MFTRDNVEHYNTIDTNTKYTYIKQMTDNDLDLESVKKIFCIIGKMSENECKIFSQNILKNIENKFEHNTIEVLRFIVSQNPSMITLVDEHQKRMYELHWSNPHFKKWVEYFPMDIYIDENLQFLYKFFSNANYKKITLLSKLIPFYKVKIDRQNYVLAFILHILSNIINSNFDKIIKFNRLHKLLVDYSMTENQCIQLASCLLNFATDKSVFNVISLLRLKIYDFDKKKILTNYSERDEIDVQIEIDWCMRQYILHDLSANIIWTLIIKRQYTMWLELPINYKNLLIFHDIKQNLNGDIMLNICMLLQLMDFWEMRDESLPMFNDYKIGCNDNYLELNID
jgi:hypothetical protein